MGRNPICGIYAIWVDRGPEKSKQGYIGSSKDVEHRRREHFSALTKGTHNNLHLQRAWNKYGATAFRFELLFTCGLEERFALEELTISILDTFHHGYNLTPNVLGRINAGLSLPPQHRKRIAEATRRRYEKQSESEKTSLSLKQFWIQVENRDELLAVFRTPEHRRKCSKLTLASWKDEEIRKKRTEGIQKTAATPRYHENLSLSLVGKPKSEEHCKNISKGAKKKYRDPEEHKKTSESLLTPEVHEVLSARSKASWQNVKYRQSQIQERTKRWENPEYRKMMSEVLKAAWAKRKGLAVSATTPV